MNKIRKKWKAIVLSLGLAVMMLPATHASAQVINLLDEYYDELDQQSNSGPLLMRGTATINDNVENGGFSFADFGEAEPSPLGSGIAILIVASLGYVTLKKKEDEL